MTSNNTICCVVAHAIMNVPWRAEVEAGEAADEDEDVFFHLCLLQEIQCAFLVNNRADHVYSGVFVSSRLGDI